MKLCPVCRHTYPDDYQSCPRDGTVLASISSEIVSGTVLRGKYEVICELGAGGMAVVYKVRHKAFHELAAVKVVHPHFLNDPEFIKRFRNEAIVARQLKHPNAVRIDDFDYTDDGRPFIVMEFVDGHTLYDVRKKREGPWPVDLCIDVISQAAAALGAAHSLGIVHRDIKPSNILLLNGQRDHGQVKVMDFGIAKVSGPTFAGMTSVVTQHSFIIGTPEYMSPEQATGVEAAIDGRADLYSLGLVLYEMLTGSHPFKADTPMGMVVHQLNTLPPPPESLGVRVPPALSALVLRALEKDRQKRFRSAAEMLAALQDPSDWYAAQSGFHRSAAESQSLRLRDADLNPQSANGQTTVLTSTPDTLTAARPNDDPATRQPLPSRKPPAWILLATALVLCGALVLTVLIVRRIEERRAATAALSSNRGSGPATAPDQQVNPPASPVTAPSEPQPATRSSQKDDAARQLANDSHASPSTDEKDWRSVERTTQLAKLDAYLKTHPGGAFHAQALAKREDLVWAQSQAANSSAALNLYLQQYPSGRYSQRARDELVALELKAIEAATDPVTLEPLLNRYPTGDIHNRVVSRLDDLLWARTAKDASGFNSYLGRFPGGKHAAEAHSQLQAARPAPTNPQPVTATATEVRPDVRPDDSKPPAQHPATDEKAGIMSALASYQQAYDRQDIGAIVHVWPTIPGQQRKGLVDTFNQMKSIQLNYQVLSGPDVSGNNATVRLSLTIAYSLGAAPKISASKVVVGLKKGSQNEWYIDSIH